jgi:hypothetical protein
MYPRNAGENCRLYVSDRARQGDAARRLELEQQGWTGTQGELQARAQASPGARGLLAPVTEAAQQVEILK